ncbi:MAG: DUF1648 domain-containing protein [Deltaproteobacteria bacterium]|nr:DUF1648 domain-containing protein [Deltaproteobacteria bacterium]
MRQQPTILVVVLAVLAALFVIFTSAQLPAVVASHFNFSGNPDAWMKRENYVAFMVIFILVYPALMTLAFIWLPRKFPALVNIPRRDYWLAPERREESLKYLANHGCWFSCLLLLTLAGVHYALVVGHRTQPPALPLPLFFAVLGCLGVGVIVWTIKLLRRFPKPTV